MSKGTEVIVTSEPKGVFEECIISGTPKPGTCMEIVPATAPVGGRFTYRAITRADGAIGPICVLREDSLQGKTLDDAYVSGTRGFLYWPVAGEQLNMLINDVAGTGDDYAIGDALMVEQTTGQLKDNSGGASAPFRCLEVVTDPAADFHMWVQYCGNQA